jgi:hypothetical protein
MQIRQFQPCGGGQGHIANGMVDNLVEALGADHQVYGFTKPSPAQLAATATGQKRQ